MRNIGNRRKIEYLEALGGAGSSYNKVHQQNIKKINENLQNVLNNLSTNSGKDSFSSLNPDIPVPRINPQRDSENLFQVKFNKINQDLQNILEQQKNYTPPDIDTSNFNSGLPSSGKSQYFQADFKPRSNLYLSSSESSPANLLAGVPLVQMGAEDSTKKTFEELLGNRNLQDLIADARSQIGTVSPASEHYQTALIEQSMVHDVINGFVFGNNSEVLNKKLESLDPKYKEALKSKGFTDSSVRERYLAMVAAYGDKGFSPEQNPLSVVMKDIIQGTIKELESKGRTLEVDKRDDKGEVVKDENRKILKESITIDNFVRYLDDPSLQNAIGNYVKSNADYHKGGYERIIADYQAHHPDVVPVTDTNTDEPSSVSKTQLTNASGIYGKIDAVQNKPYVLDASNPKSKSEELRNQEKWDDYAEIQWGAESEQGLFFKTDGAKERVEKLYKDLVDENSLERMDQITVLVVTLLKKASNGQKLTNEQRQFLKDISNNNNSWTPKGASTKKIDEIIQTIKFQ